ncbi:MAG: M48 family metallopeptidase [Bacteroidetes bacterium]|nr:M48 family metallopeptidase [Bacteroidota bacterium]
MKKLPILFFILILTTNSSLIAQEQPNTNSFKNNYFTVKPKGDVPYDLSLLFSEAYKREKEELEKNNSTQREHLNKTNDKFLQESNYFINQILLSGKVLYNTPLNTYVDKIVDKILINDPDLRKQIRVYILKSPTVNASATDKGIMFVNLGLLAQAGSESQLAFILSHELIHYVKKHNLNLYLEKDRISRENKGFRSASLSQILYKTHFRSREMESEADEKGFDDYFKKTNYDLNQVMEVYDVLQYAYLPFDEIAFNYTFLTDSLFNLPGKYIPESINSIRARDDYDDENSTHPNIKKRRELMQNSLKGIDNKGRSINPSGTEYFNAIRDMAKFECLRLYTIEQNYSMAFYNAWLMKKDYPDNLFIDQVISASLYGITKYKNRNNSSNILPSEKKTEGEIHAVVCLFKNIKKAEINALALRFVFKACEKFPNDNYLNKIKKDLFKELIWGNKAKLSMFVNASQIHKQGDTTLAEINKQDSIIKQSSKVRNIEKKKKLNSDEGYYQYIFAGLLSNNSFVKEFNKTTDEYDNYKIKEKEKIAKNKNEKKLKDINDDDLPDFFDDDDYIRYNSHDQNFGCKIGIDSILLYNPFYMKIDYNKTEKIKFFDTESSQLKFIELLKNNAKKLGLAMEVVVPSAINEQGTDLYNNHLILNDWTDEFSNWDIKGEKVMFLSEEIKPLINQYKTRYLDLSGIISAKSNSLDGNAFYMIVYSVLSPVMLPITIQYFASHTFNSIYYNLLLDMQTGDVIFLNSSKIEMRDNKAYLNSRIYDTFNQIKTK